jgi:predicted permease
MLPEWTTALWLRLKGLLRRGQLDRDLDDELQFHLAMRQERLEEQGVPPDEAHCAARREFGNTTEAEEMNREMWTFPLLETLWQDIRYGLRQLRRNPGFAAVAVLTLALGIGANTAIFSVVNGILLKPLPYPQPDQLVAVLHNAPGIHETDLGMSASMYFVYRDQSRSFQDIGLYGNESVSVTGLAEPQRVRALDVTDGLLPILGVRPILGRLFTRLDEQPSSPDTVMLTYNYWTSAFGDDRKAIGKTIEVDGTLREIVGVLPQRFRFLDEPTPALILPIRLDRAKTTLGNFGSGIARLKPGVTLAQANADVARMLPIVARSFPPPPRFSLEMYESVRLQPDVRPLKQEVVGDVSQTLWLLMGGIGLVLLIACANVANLLLVRVEGRRQELAIRAALGASPARIAGQLLLESVTLSMLGSVLGLAFAYGALRILIAMAPSTLPRLNEIGIDGTVLLFAMGISLVASLLFGSAPVLKYAGKRLGSRLSEAGRSQSVSRERHQAQNLLVVVQVALALVLLISSGLMIRTFRALMHVQPGFTAPPAEVQAFHVVFPPGTDVKQPEQALRIEQAILHKIKTIPGVASASISDWVPMEMEGRLFRDPVFIRNRTTLGVEPPSHVIEYTSPGTFSTVGVPLIAGRDFTWNDVYNKLLVAIVSENLAREYWHDPADAIGKQIRMGATDEWHEIVGVVGDVHDDGINKPAPTEVYWPIVSANMWGHPVINVSDGAAFVIRSARAGSETFMREVQGAVRSVDPDLPLLDVFTLAHFYRQSMARASFSLVMLAIASGMALLLGAIGLYGVISYSVSQRTHDIGVRMALGAQKSEVLRLVMWQGTTLTLVGVAIGVAVALGVTRFLSSLLYGVKPTDLLTFVAIPLLLTVVALVACYIPARRATKVDPMVALRHE